jgi:hypothetical protein
MVQTVDWNCRRTGWSEPGRNGRANDPRVSLGDAREGGDDARYGNGHPCAEDLHDMGARAAPEPIEDSE